MLKAVIVEDERHSREVLKNLVNEYCQDTEIVGMADSVNTGVEIINQLKPDLVFLDVEMPSGTGFDLLEQLPNPDFAVVFTTAFRQYSGKAEAFGATDYLLKPIDIDDLQAAVSKVRQK